MSVYLKWNWQQKTWPHFTYQIEPLSHLEDQFLRESGILLGVSQHMDPTDRESFMIELIVDEAVKTSEIEGEVLSRDSVQSSLRSHFGLAADHQKIPPAEYGVAELMMDLYRYFEQPLTSEMLCEWHRMLMNGRRDVKVIGAYRQDVEPMQVVSGPIHAYKVHFEAPPFEIVTEEMDKFIIWFNRTAPGGEAPLPALTRAGIVHLYFVCIHPFEDGNGRIARALAEKALSQSLKNPTLIALSYTIQAYRKNYYDRLNDNNKNMNIDNWLQYFAETILMAQKRSLSVADFLVHKAKFYMRYKTQMNERQAKVIGRLFKAGPSGFKGGLSAENYIAIAGTSRATATRDLHDLVEKKMLTQSGVKKSTRYEFCFIA
jgi:Fic family protein